MGMERIQKNLGISSNDIIQYIKNKILDENCSIYRMGKNLYCETDDIRITVNASCFTVITAHRIKENNKNV